mgnify:CR=1 FL=1
MSATNEFKITQIVDNGQIIQLTLIENVSTELKKQLEELPRKEIATKAKARVAYLYLRLPLYNMSLDLVVRLFENKEDIGTMSFSVTDIVRDPIVKIIEETFDEWEEKNAK